MERFEDSAELRNNQGGYLYIIEELVLFDSNKSETISEELTLCKGVVLIFLATSV